MALVRLKTHTPDLFVSAEVRAALDAPFDEWLAALRADKRLKRDSSSSVYEAMWASFADWCVGQDPTISLDSLTTEQLARFLDDRKEMNGNSLTPRHRFRVASLIARVLEHRAGRGAPLNTAASALLRDSAEFSDVNSDERKPHLDYMASDQAAQLVVYLRSVRPGAVGRRKLEGWQDLRNHTAVALHLGAGLTPGDVRGLLMTAPIALGGRVKRPSAIHVEGNGNRPPRDTPLSLWASELLQYWLEERKKLEPQLKSSATSAITWSKYLFPSRTGAQWGKVAHYEAVQKVLEAAGIESAVGGSGGLRLRHTFAVRQFKMGVAPDVVARYMGIKAEDEVERYRSVALALMDRPH